MPRDAEERPPPGFALYTYRWMCHLDASGRKQECIRAQFTRNAHDPSLQAMIKLGDVKEMEIGRALHLINTIVQEAIYTTNVEPRSANRCPPWLGYAVKVSYRFCAHLVVVSDTFVPR